jgi:hypothetical protein
MRDALRLRLVELYQSIKQGRGLSGNVVAGIVDTLVNVGWLICCALEKWNIDRPVSTV